MSPWGNPDYPRPKIFRGVIEGNVMDFQVLNRTLMAYTAYDDRDYIVISIADPGQRLHHDQWVNVFIPESPRRLGVIELDFHDLDRPVNGYTLMSEEQARQLVEWMKNFAPENEEKWPLVVVHCEMGMCRSSAIAAALSKHWNGSDEFFWTKASGFLPNKWVYDAVTKALEELNDR